MNCSKITQYYCENYYNIFVTKSKKILANKWFFMYTELRCDIRAKTQKVAAYKNIMYAGFSEERCPVQETGRHGHCTEYRKKIFSKKENSSVYLYVARYVRMSVQSPLVVLKFNSAKRRGLFLWLTQKLESV